MVNVHSGGRTKVRAKKIIITIISVLAVIGITIGASNAFDVKAKTTYEDIEKFPESYKEALYALKEKHPNWTFEVMDTGLNWSEVVYNEMNPSNRSLVPTYFDSKFVGAYYGDGWACATQEAVEYYLDPRNWLTEDYIFQFEKLTFNDDAQRFTTVQKVLQNTFMSGCIQSDAQNNYEAMGLTYAQAFYDIGKYIGVSPVHLATRVKQEQGTQGTSDLISGVYPGYEGYYNYYNIQASGSTHEQIVANGLNEAKSEGWNTRYVALLGGSQKVANRYILRGQDTLYLQKFDVDGQYDGRYWHQYMQNLAAPSNEGRNTKKAYASAGMLDEAFVFKIPVYKNMSSSEEYSRQFVERLYSVVLGRQCSAEESNGWVKGLTNNSISCADTAYGFVFSEEYTSKHTTNRQFIVMLYNTLLNRTPDESEVQGWLDAFTQKYSRKFIFQQFSTAPEFAELCTKYGLTVGKIELSKDEIYDNSTPEEPTETPTKTPTETPTQTPTETPTEEPTIPGTLEGADGFVQRLYHYILRRECSETEIKSWSNALIDGTISPRDTVYGFVDSEEFISYNVSNTDFVKILYKAILGRTGSDEEMQGWIAYLNETGDRDYIVDGFLNSEEFNALLEQYGLK
jgi:beta-N-acetylglucosaminidase